MTTNGPTISLLDELSGEPESTRALVIHGMDHADADGFYPDAPSRRDIALALLKRVESLDGKAVSAEDSIRIGAIQMTLGWVMGWGDLELPEIDEEDER